MIFNQYLTNTNRYILETNIICKIQGTNLLQIRSISFLKANKNSKQCSWRTIISQSNLDMDEYKAKLKTVEKWEKDLKVKLSKDLEGDFVT